MSLVQALCGADQLGAGMNMRHFSDMLRDRRGATGVEYALVASLIAVVLASGFASLGNAVSTQMEGVEQEYSSAQE